MLKSKALVCHASILRLPIPDAFRSIGIRAIKNCLLSVDDVIQRYQSKFADLKSNFEGRAILETEIAVGRVESTVPSIDITLRRPDHNWMAISTRDDATSLPDQPHIQLTSLNMEINGGVGILLPSTREGRLLLNGCRLLWTPLEYK
jgi:hypothetical protein